MNPSGLSVVDRRFCCMRYGISFMVFSRYASNRFYEKTESTDEESDSGCRFSVSRSSYKPDFLTFFFRRLRLSLLNVAYLIISSFRSSSTRAVLFSVTDFRVLDEKLCC